MKNFEKIEAYFNNELTVSEKEEFLREVELDADLKAEYNFQNDVINGIKDARKAELKAMLNNVQISSVGTTNTVLSKILAGGAVTLLIGSSIWYYNYSSQPAEKLPKNPIVDAAPILEDKSITDEQTNEIAESEVADKTTNDTSNPKVKIESKKDSPKLITPTIPSSDSEFEAQPIAEENLDIPNDITKATINLNSNVDVEIKVKKKYNFHYQYLKGKLFLYGSFEEGLFEIIELNKEDEIEMFLYFKSNYYSIDDTSGSIIPLKPIEDKNLKLKLEDLR